MQHLGEGQPWSAGQGALEGLCMVEVPRFGGPNGKKPAEDAFTKLLANFEAQELPSTLHQSSALTPLRRQRKSCRPLRIPTALGTSPPAQDDNRTCLVDGAFPIKHHPPASLEVHKSGTFSGTQDQTKSKPLSPNLKGPLPKGQLLQNGMKQDCMLPTAPHENSWDFRNLSSSATRYDNKLLNGDATHGRAGFSSLPNVLQKDKNFDSLCSTVCRNGACQAEISLEASFCRRCSCCICKLFDNKRDASLWFVCDPNGGGGCGLSCHIECALKQQVAGVILNTDGSIPSLDGSYFCHSCRATTPLIGCWREQLLIAKNASTLDILHYRLLLSYRLLKGTKRYEEAQGPVEEAMKKVDTEVAQMLKGAVKLRQYRVDMLSCKIDVQRLINLALEKADDTRILTRTGATKQAGLHSTAFMVCFEDVSPSSIVVAVNVRGIVKPKLLGYKLWHRRASESAYASTPTSVLYNMDNKYVVSNLHPLTDYTFKVVPFSKEGDLAVCEAGCSTKGAEHVVPPVDVYASLGVLFINTERVDGGTSRCMSQAFDPDYHRDNGKNGPKIQDLDEVLVEQDGQGYHASTKSPGTQKELHDNHEGLVSVHAKGGTPVRDDRKEHLASWNMTAAQEGRNLHSLDALGPKQFQTGIGNSHMRMGPCNSMDCWDDKLSRKCLKTATKQDLHSCSERCYHTVSSNQLHSSTQTASTSKLSNCNPPQRWVKQGHGNDNAATAASTKADINGSVRQSSERMQGVFTCNSEAEFSDYEFSVKVIRWLECKGHLKEEFRMKFLTWFTLRASEQEKRVISVFIDTLQDDPASLAGQLVDAFEEMIGVDKRPSTLDSFCRRLW